MERVHPCVCAQSKARAAIHRSGAEGTESLRTTDEKPPGQTSYLRFLFKWVGNVVLENKYTLVRTACRS